MRKEVLLETIAFWTGHSVACYIHSLASPTPLTFFTSLTHSTHSLHSLAPKHYASLRSLPSRAPFAGSHGLRAHSLSMWEFMNIYSCWKSANEQTIEIFVSRNTQHLSTLCVWTRTALVVVTRSKMLIYGLISNIPQYILNIYTQYIYLIYILKIYTQNIYSIYTLIYNHINLRHLSIKMTHFVVSR